MNFVDYLVAGKASNDAPFLVGKDENSYRELVDDVTRISSALYRRYGRGQKFILLSDNCYFFISSYLSIMKSGNVPLLLEPNIDPKVLTQTMSRTSPAGYFIQAKRAEKYDVDNVITEDALDGYVAVPEEIPDTEPNDVATVVFTSGSTAEKKGVIISHRNLMANTRSIVQYLHLNANDRVLVTLPLHYCYGASLMHTHLYVGGSMVLFEANFLGAVPNYIDRFSCTGFSGVPSTYQILLSKSDFLDRKMPSLRYMTQAGGKLENPYIERIVRAFPQKEFFVMYGATEATARMSYLPPELALTKLGSIGKGIPGVELKVLSGDGKEVRPGQVGEIVARGENVMQGYYQDDQGTATVLKEGAYFTGDLATVDEDGYIYIVGRCRQIIKSAGYRISPYEIENRICGIDGVGQCIVLGIPDEIMGEAVTAIIRPNPNVNHQSLRENVMKACKRDLASYKSPKHLLFIPELPLNASNKVDRMELRKMAIALLGGKGNGE